VNGLFILDLVQSVHQYLFQRRRSGQGTLLRTRFTKDLEEKIESAVVANGNVKSVDALLEFGQFPTAVERHFATEAVNVIHRYTLYSNFLSDINASRVYTSLPDLNM
jgi:hypothetical protein